MSFKAVPVTILTGFLGAGKTTFLNHLIAENPQKKFVIIENEFGEINIDSQLVINTDENIFELSNGCICCSVNGDLAALLNKLVTGPYDYDHLIIETTGIADPSAVAATFLTDYNIQTAFKLDGVIGIVDTLNILDVLGIEEEASKQIAFSDFLIFNKSSEASAAILAEVKEKVKALNPFADFVFTDYSKTPSTALLQLYAYDKSKVRFNLGFKTDDKPLLQLKPETHHHNIVSQSYILKPSFDLLKLRHYFSVMLMIQGAYFYRIKGILNIEGFKKQLIIQSVKGAPVFTEGDDWKNDEERETRIVFIGKNLKREILEKGLKQCFYP